jgi:hypothetical protein
MKPYRKPCVLVRALPERTKRTSSGLRTQGSLTIAEPKTAGSRRHVSIGSLAVDALNRHKVNQTAERLLKGSGWHDNGLVFANEVGKPLEDTNIRRRSLEPLLARQSCPGFAFTTSGTRLRPSFSAKASTPRSFRSGSATVELASRWTDLYSHVTPTMQKQAAEAMDSLLRAAR